MRQRELKIQLIAKRCPQCNSPLVLIEDSTYVWIGCEKCGAYARIEKRTIAKKIAGRNVFPWNEIIEGLYEALYQIYQ